MRRMYRQGDILLVEVNKKPKDVVKKEEFKNRDCILAEGEATGHHHRVKNAMAVLLTLAAGERILQLQKEASFVHEEHGEIRLPEGDWQVIRQQEYTPRGIREVLD